jgi:hypothetical protein
MKKLRPCAAAFLAAAVVACLSMSVSGQTASDGNLANVAGGGSSAKWEITATNAGGTLTISFPDGRSIRKTFRAGDSPQVTIGDKYFDNLPDGVYSYELRLASAPSDAAKKARGKDDDPENERAGRKRSPVSAMTQSGSFAVVNGSIVVSGGVEPGQKREPKASTGPAGAPATRATASANVLQRIRRNHRAFFMPDNVIADDLIVQGSACVGLDCVNGEAFNFDTIRMKENNTRILFLDTSTSAGFSTNDWIIRANSSSSGGESFLGIVDHANAGTGAETGTIIAQFDAGAPANSLRVSSNGKVGFRTATPVLDLHMNTSDTPAVRFEQNNSGGFSAQTWDIGANEANFFVRDVTGGSRLSFRIRPGAPTSSIDISADGDVGIGTASPNARVDLKQASDDFLGGLHLRRASTNDTWAIVTGGDNNLYMGYATDASLANAIADFTIFPLVVTANNRVGVRTAAPDQALSVNGEASKTGGGSWLAFSDERLKTIKSRFTLGLNAVMKLQPVRYRYKADNALALNSEGEHVGFGAQELQKVIPEAVTRNEQGYLMVNNDPILWSMLNAIKEQQQQIAELKAEVRKLKTTARRRRR